MSLLIFAIVVILVVGLFVYVLEKIPFPEGPFKWIAQVLLVIIGALVILQRAALI